MKDLTKIKFDSFQAGQRSVLKHNVPSPETVKRFESMQQNLDLIVKMIEQLDAKQEERMSRFCDDNAKQHAEIIRRQDHTNGSIGDLKKRQLYLRAVLGTLGAVVIVALTLFNIFSPEFRGILLKLIFKI